MTQQNNNNISAIAAIWALIESGLGGFMHAAHLPFTGIFVGGFAVLSIGFLAHNSLNPFPDILKATLVVLAIKFAVNPATSPMAYVAVAFQSTLGALLFAKRKWIIFTAIPFAIIAMLESAAQKLLILWLFMGNNFMDSFNSLTQKILTIFGISSQINHAEWIIGFYLLIYFIWGLALGYWIIKLPMMIEKRKNIYLNLDPNNFVKQKYKRKKSLVFIVLFILLLILIYYINFEQGWQEGLYFFIKTMALIAVWFFIISPLIIKWIRKNWATQKNAVFFMEVNQHLNELQTYVKPLYNFLKPRHNGITLIKEFILGLIVIGFYRHEP